MTKEILFVQKDHVFTLLCKNCEWMAEFPRGDTVADNNAALVDFLHARLDHKCPTT